MRDELTPKTNSVDESVTLSVGNEPNSALYEVDIIPSLSAFLNSPIFSLNTRTSNDICNASVTSYLFIFSTGDIMMFWRPCSITNSPLAPYAYTNPV